MGHSPSPPTYNLITHKASRRMTSRSTFLLDERRRGVAVAAAADLAAAGSSGEGGWLDAAVLLPYNGADDLADGVASLAADKLAYSVASLAAAGSPDPDVDSPDLAAAGSSGEGGWLDVAVLLPHDGADDLADGVASLAADELAGSVASLAAAGSPDRAVAATTRWLSLDVAVFFPPRRRR
uniref:Uncharacterized protein n=1 Tax=Oryza rufipogon TaxID=4529 RepID=A0A0E0MV33_ORYRU